MVAAMTSTDVLVAGAGAAGLVAALAAAHHGARVLLLDSGQPSTFATSGGLFSAPGTRWQREAGIEDSPDLFIADVRAKNGDTVPDLLLRTVAQQAAATADFIDGPAGVPLHLHTTTNWPGHAVKRLHATAGESGTEFNSQLRAALARFPAITFIEGADVTALLPDQTGADYVKDGQTHRAEAGATILATGGYGGAPDLLARFAPPARHAVHAGGAGSTGFGVRVAADLGADMRCMDAYQGQPHVSPHLIGTVRPRFGASLPALGSVMVNREGRRFCAEDMGPSEMTGVLLSQPGGRAVEIWDEHAQQAAQAGGPFRRAVELGAMTRCETVAEIAARFSLPEAVLAETLAQAVACAKGEATDPFGRRNWKAPLAPPFYAAEITGALAHTQGGAMVDGAARILRPDGSPIPRLFAAGGVACGISGTGTAGYIPGNGLAQSFVLGFLAGRAAATVTRGRSAAGA
jgi:fumarate reductase flavoprotein subunit